MSNVKEEESTSHLIYLGKRLEYKRYIYVCGDLFFNRSFLLYLRKVIYIKQDLLINEQIRVREVQVIDEEGKQLGKMSTMEAIDLAYSKSMDLVLVSGNIENPTCKIMNYGKYKFEQSKKEKETKKKQKIVELKEIRITPNIEEHDFNFKSKNATKFLEAGNKVKITVRFRGRELNYVKLGEEVLNNFAEGLSEVSVIEKPAKLEGKNMFLILAPNK